MQILKSLLSINLTILFATISPMQCARTSQRVVARPCITSRASRALNQRVPVQNNTIIQKRCYRDLPSGYYYNKLRKEELTKKIHDIKFDIYKAQAKKTLASTGQVAVSGASLYAIACGIGMVADVMSNTESILQVMILCEGGWVIPAVPGFLGVFGYGICATEKIKQKNVIEELETNLTQAEQERKQLESI